MSWQRCALSWTIYVAKTKMEAKYFIFFKELSDEIHTLSKGK